jgi:hypothetical protein
VINTFVLSDLLVGLSNRGSPRAVRSHVHPDCVDDAVVASEAGLLRVGLLGDHGAFSNLTTLIVVHHRVKSVKLFEKLCVIFVVLNFVGE